MTLLKHFPAVLLALLLFSLGGCRKRTGANWDIDAVLPVVNSTLNIKNFMSDSIIKTDQSGLLYLGINREVAAIKLDSLFSLPDTTIVRDFTVPLAIPLTPGSPIDIFPPSEVKFNISNGVELKRVDIRKGFLKVKFTNNVSQPVDLVYRIPSATRNGQPLTITETIPPGKHSLSREYDLAGYSLNMTGLSGNLSNALVQTYTFALNAAAPSATANPPIVASLELGYNGLVPEYIEGYFGQQTIKIPVDTARFNLINNFKASDFLLSEVTMDFKILNEFGVDFNGSINNIKSINSVDNKVIELSSGKLSNLDINRAPKVKGVVSPTTKQVVFNTANSNIAAFISNLPDKLTYGGQVTINPLGRLFGHQDFAFYNTGIRIRADINIPLRFTAGYFRLRSTAKVGFSDLEQLDNVNSGNFVISAKNGYPFSARLQAYMLNGAGQVIDSLFVPGSNTIARGEVNAQNVVTAPVRSKVNIPISREKIANLKNCKSIRIDSYFLLPPNPPEIRIYENYELEVDIIAELNYHVGVKSN